MANPAPSGTDDYNTTIIEEFRANGGRLPVHRRTKPGLRR